ncbi:hypothetical protein [Sphingomonas sp. PB4P5]|uniref:hypothetical protein n=1 Tax=Parasphingomonas puruogangriensis TaxID=3096155 RepID=UPI002FC75B63
MPLIRNPWPRRALVVALVAICALLTLFPQRYLASVSLTPTDPGSLGLSGTLGQLGAVNSVFGNQAAVEVSLKVARSEAVRALVIKQLKLDRRLALSPLETHRWLDHHVDIQVLRGGILQIDLKQRDPNLARDVVSAYGVAVRDQLTLIARRQTDQKRAILLQLFDDAGERLARARGDYDTFRLTTRYSSPQAAFYAAGDRIPALEADIRAKEVELSAMRQFATDDNIRVRQLIAGINAVRQQLATARSTSPGQQSSVGQVVRQTTQAEKLKRELDIAQTLYDNYKRFLQGTSVEDLTSSVNVRILETAYIDTSRQYNVAPLAVGVVIFLLALMLEFYALRPPVVEARLSRSAA